MALNSVHARGSLQALRNRDFPELRVPMAVFGLSDRLGKLGTSIAISLLAVVLVSCSTSHPSDVSIVNTSPAPEPATAGPVKAAQIMQLLASKSFTYSRAGGRKGTVLFNADGTFSYNEAGKGEGTGVWQASEGKLCQAFDPTSFLPKGTRSECAPFTIDGGSYVAGNARFNPV